MRLPSGTVTLVFADMVGSTRLLGHLKERYAAVLADYRRLLSEEFRAGGGELVDTQGDGVFFAFPQARSALGSAVRAQRALRGHTWPDGVTVTARIGLHTGEPMSVESGYVGMDVHRAARIAAAGSGAHIFLSQTTRDLVVDDLPEGVTLTDLGEHALKDLAQAQRIYQVRAEGVPADVGRVAPIDIRSTAVAVLPLRNLSSDPEQEYFSDGMTEALIADLAKIGALKVISRTSAMTYKGSDRSLPQIARELGVNAVLQGSILRSGDRVRIGAQLIDAATDTHIWAETYERRMTDVLTLQSEIAEEIARQVKIKLTPQERARLRSRAVDPLAHDAYLRGRYHLNRATPLEVTTAIQHLEEATGRDPEHALAHAGLATAFNYLGWLGAGAPRDVFPKAKAAAMRALAIDEDLAEAHAALGYTATFYDWDWRTAERELERAVTLNPSYAEGYLHLSWYLGSQDRLDEQLAAITRASELDPHSLVIHANLPNHHQWKRDFDAALTEAERTLELAPDFPLALLFAGMAHWGKAQYAAATTRFARLVALVGPGFNGYLGYSLAMDGRVAEAERILDELILVSKTSRVPAFQFFLVLLGLGRTDEALSSLERAFEDRDSPFMPYLRLEVVFDPLRDHPRFKALVAQMDFAS